MIIELKTEMVNFLMREVEDAKSLILKSNKLENDNTELEISDIGELQLLINDEIVCRGMDNQDSINDLGKKLYELYDEVLYQKNQNNES